MLAAVIMSAMAWSAASCVNSELYDEEIKGSSVQFTVSGPGWNDGRRHAEAEGSEDKGTVKEIMQLEGEGLKDSLFLHVVESDWNDSKDAAEDSALITRGAPVTTSSFHSSMGVSAYLYSGSWTGTTETPNYFYNVEVTSSSSWTTNYPWLGYGSRRMRFYAYAPYNASGMTLSAQTVAGPPTIGYTVPSDVTQQTDLVTATADVPANNGSAVALQFGHALTAVKFSTGDDFISGTITDITLKNVYGKGNYTIGSTSWSGQADKKDFTQTLSVGISQNSDITTGVKTFMMIPQTLPSDAQIVITYTDSLSNSNWTLTANIGGQTWEMGKTVIYKISTSSFVLSSVFVITPPNPISYRGGDSTYSVQSYSIYVSNGVSGNPIASLPWTAEFVQDNGSGGYNVISKPSWINVFTTSGEGGVDPQNYTVRASNVTGQVKNTRNAALKSATPISGVYDLSTKGGTTSMNTANCYVINAPGTYKFPLVYGNAIKNGSANPSAYSTSVTGTSETPVLNNFVNHLNAAITNPYIYNNSGCTPADAVLVWQDAQNLVTNIQLTDSNQYIQFTVPQSSIKQGNAIIAVRDASKTIMWSWQIWVTNYVPGTDIKTVTNLNHVQYRLMPINLGWCEGDTTYYYARSVKVRFTQATTGQVRVISVDQTGAELRKTMGDNTYYQWGRKDPFPGAQESTRTIAPDKTTYTGTGTDAYPYTIQMDTIGISIGNSIRTPNIFYRSDHTYTNNSPKNDWSDTHYSNLWDANNNKYYPNWEIDKVVVKTIYDPCPVGFHIPSYCWYSAATYNGENSSNNGFLYAVNSPFSSSDVTKNKGIEFYCNPMPAVHQWDPSGGTIFLPKSGYRGASSGRVVMYNGSEAFYFCAQGYVKGHAPQFIITTGWVSPKNHSNKRHADIIRPVQE